MEFDSQLLQDLLDFLRTLEGVSLPPKFENLRGKLLGRVRTAISVASNYMDMQPGKPLKSDNSVADDSSEDYVVADQKPQSPSSFLYQFKYKKVDNIDGKLPQPPPPRPATKPSPLESSDPIPPQSTRKRAIQLPVIAPEEEPEILETVTEPDPLLEIYNNMSLARAEAMSHYCGKLQRRGKWFLFENIRPFWAALVGHHLLSYDNRIDQKPGLVISVKGCTCKPAVASQRNVKKFVESTFEITFDDGRLYEFIASTPKEMEQWVAMIVRWEARAHETNISHQPAPVPEIPEEEPPSDDPSSNDYYDDLVIHDIAGALAAPAKTPKSNGSKSPVVQRTEQKSSLEIPDTKPIQASPTHPKVFNRVLPPPPSAAQNSEQEDEVYHVIDDHVQPSPSAHLGKRVEVQTSSVQNAGGTPEELYDDIETVREEVKQLELVSQSKKETEKSFPALEIADDDFATYDDVGVLRNEAEQSRKSETSIAKESPEIEKEKKPYVPPRPSPMKNFFGRFRNKSESPEKETAKKKLPVSSPQQIPKTQNTIETTIDRNPPDLSNYNSVPPPRPVKAEKSLSDDEEESIYDDVLNKKETYNNHVVDLKSVLEKRKENQNSTRESERLGPPLSAKPQRSVARNLNDAFDGEIYQNQNEVGNVEEELEHYQVPRADANTHPLNSLQDDDEEKIYDDVAIVAQKKREVEQSKLKPAVKTPPKFTKGPAVMAKPSTNKLFNKFNKFPLSVSDKSSAEKNSQHRLIAGKKPKTQEANIPLKKRLLPAADEDLYDDCLSK